MSAVSTDGGSSAGVSSGSSSIVQSCIWLLVLSVLCSAVAPLAARAGVPLITACMLLGCACGPALLSLISTPALADLAWLSPLALSVIGFTAGSELHLPQLRPLLPRIACITGCLTCYTCVLCGAAVYALASVGLVPWLSPYIGLCASGVSLLAATIMVARSPASAIAVVNELRANGAATTCMLAVTVVSDVLVIALFSVSSSIALTQSQGLPLRGGPLLMTAVGLLAAVCSGGLVAGIVLSVLSLPPRLGYVLFPLGFVIFAACKGLTAWTADQYGTALVLDPLLVCVTAGCVAANIRDGRRRAALRQVLSTGDSLILIPFFVKVGLELQPAALLSSLPLALALVCVRIACTVLAVSTAACLTPMQETERRFLWMTLLAQAGLSLGLVSDAAERFPDWGDALQTVVTAVVVVNQLLGPAACRYALLAVFKEAGKAPEAAATVSATAAAARAEETPGPADTDPLLQH